MNNLSIEENRKVTMNGDSKVKDPVIPSNVYLMINNQVIPIMRRETRLGRNLENDLVIQDVLVSRIHAKIMYEDSKFFLCDLNSTGGCYINGKKVDIGALNSGDEISLATVKITFVIEAPEIETQSDKETGKLL